MKWKAWELELWSWSLWPTVKVKRRAWDLELEPFSYRRRDETKYLSVRQNNESTKLFSTRAHYRANLLNYASQKAIPGAARSFVSRSLACWLGEECCEQQAFLSRILRGLADEVKLDILQLR